LASAEYAVAICIGVTARPWPIGMFPIDEPEYCSGRSTMPLASPGTSTFVPVPKPNRRTQLSNRFAPSFRPIFTEPTLEDWARMSATVIVRYPCAWASSISRSATLIMGGTGSCVCGRISRSSSAPATVNGLNVEPGS